MRQRIGPALSGIFNFNRTGKINNLFINECLTLKGVNLYLANELYHFVYSDKKAFMNHPVNL